MVDIDYTMPSKKEILQKLEEKCQKAQEAFEREEKAKKELEGLYSKLLAEKTNLLAQLEGEKGSLSETQERANKLQAQKSDLESQLQVRKNVEYLALRKHTHLGGSKHNLKILPAEQIHLNHANKSVNGLRSRIFSCEVC